MDESPVSPSPAASAPHEQEELARQEGETQLEKFRRLYSAGAAKLAAGSNNRATIESIEAAFRPQVISGIGEITGAKLCEPGRPYWFKLRAIYKGYDAGTERAWLQDLGQEQPDAAGSAAKAVLGAGADVYPAFVMGGNAVIATFPPEANSIATFYLAAVRFTENEGRQINETGIYIRFARNIEPPPFDPAKFTVAGGMHYITVEDARSPARKETMGACFFGDTAGNPVSGVFDPAAYPPVDLKDACPAIPVIEKKEKERLEDTAFPDAPIKYVSELIFKGQSDTAVTVSTDDGLLTETMNFTGRVSALRAGDRIRAYYTAARGPPEKWEIQAIERL